MIESRALAGGDICQASLVTLDDGRRLFVKARLGAPDGMFAAEARGLEWLAQAAALRVPHVVASDQQFLALEYLPEGTPQANFSQALGYGLAQLHLCPVAQPGLHFDNFIGPLPQRNAPTHSWLAFYAEHRLRPRLQEVQARGVAPQAWRERFERLFTALPSMVPEEPLSRLHGDLWRGNLLVGPSGEPCLVDPAVYGGHREVDLAMMRLFGGFSEAVYEAYQEVAPLQPGHEKRVALYQLYPLLVHVVLFGGGYVSSVERALQELGF